MSWLELSLTIHAQQQTAVEGALEDLGALSITLRDADADTPDERAIFEPGVGEIPLWNEIVLQALFNAATDRAGLVAALTDLAPELSPERITFREIEEQDWTRAWMDTYQPMRFGRRLWIYPTTVEPEGLAADAVVVRLDPGLAFGTGTHPTTALCLEWLDTIADARALAGKRLIDFGCGSGVLAVAALKLGAACAIGVDNDAQALEASRINAERNAVGEKVDLYLPQHFPPQQADILIANILAGPLAELAAQFAASIAPGGLLALSGILHGQESELVEIYAAWFDELVVTQREDWVRIAGRRKN
ncbi:MAG: 50S ribosomal protein L11 methyltransferase [Gammaproteobacteria bacterium]|nr:MAG: 50S ribosomal protein L11 methyltransferase [Gammaproteobacteria bacterium]